MSEHSQYPNLAHLASFGSANRAPSSLVEGKKSDLKITTLQKKALLGTPEEQQRIALSEINGNESGRDQSIADIRDPNVSAAAFRDMYGEEALANRHRYGEALDSQERLKAAERTNSEAAWDTGMGLAGVATNLVGGVATLGAQAVDTVVTKPFNEITGVDVPYLAPNVADWTQGASEFFRGQKSELSKARSKIHAIEGALNQEDSDIITQREADAAPADEGIMGLIQRKAKQYGREAAGAIENYADDPIAQGDLAIDAIGSILGLAGANKVIVGQMMGRKLLAKYLGQGLSKQAAKAAVTAELATAEGQAALAKLAQKTIIPLIGGTEGGSSVAETLLKSKEMTPEEGAKNEAYLAIKSQNSQMTHDQITDELAHQAGNITAPIAVGIALGAGKLVSKFASNPFSTGTTTSAAEVAASTFGKQIAKRGGEVGKNVAYETSEEAIQEGGAAFASNVGLRESGVDPELALDKGVAARAAEGALGGLAGAGALQAPGLAGGVAKDVGKGALNAAGKAVDAAVKVRDEQALAGAANNPTARTEAATNAGAAYAALTTALTTPEDTGSTAEGSTAEDTEAADDAAKAAKDFIIKSMKESNEMTASEMSSNLASGFQDIKDAVANNKKSDKTEDINVPRQQLFKTMGDVYNNPKASKVEKAEAAIIGYSSVFKLQRANSIDVQEALGAIAGNAVAEEAHKNLVNNNQTVLSSPFVKQAEDEIANLTKETFEALPDIQKYLSGKADADTQTWVAETVAFVGQINSAAVSGLLVEKSLDQVNARIKKDGSNVSPQWKNLQEELVRVKALMNNDQEHAANTSLIEGALGTLKVSGDPADTRNASSVRENILLTRNAFNELPSVAESVMDFAKANLSGDRDAAYVALANIRDFATALQNKVEALDKSSYIKTKEGEAPKNKVAFMSRSSKGPFEDTNGVYANTDISSSVINAYEVRYDAVAVANAYNAMRQNPAFVNDPEFGKNIEVAAFTKNLDDAGARLDLTNVGKIDPNAPGVTGAQEKAKAVVVPGKVKTQKIITVDDARSNPNTVYIFGDNLVGKGKKGQAVIRDEPNAIGIPTKRLPSMNDNAFFGVNIEEEKAAITTAIDKIIAARESGKNIVFPEDGVGTGLAKLQEKSPEVYAHLQAELVRAGLIEAAETSTETSTKVVVEGKGSEPWFNTIKGVLVRSAKGVNYFLEGFKPTKSGLSLTQVTDPIESFLSGLGQLRRPENGLTREVSESEHAAASTLLRDVYPKFKKRFEDTVNKVLQETYEGKTYLKILTEETDGTEGKDLKDKILNFKENLPLNLLENEQDLAGNLVMNEGAIQAVFMATMEWLAKDNARGKHVMDDDALSQMFFGRKGEEITEQMRVVAQGGTLSQRVLDEIAKSTMDLLGVYPNNDTNSHLTQGLFKALAASALDTMVSRDDFDNLKQGDDRKILDMRRTDVLISPKTDNAAAVFRTYDTIQLNKNHVLSKKDGVFDSLRSMTDVFTRTFTSIDEKDRYVGAPPPTGATTQLGQNNADLSPRVQKVIRALENTASYVNVPMFSFVEAFGKGDYRDLVGYIDTSKGNYNLAHLTRIEGKNKSITSAMDGTYAYIADAQATAEAEDKQFQDIPHFFRWVMTKVGRLMQVGLVTQQGDKFMRQMISSTQSTLDMNNPDHKNFLWLAIAQSIGVNPAKIGHEAAIDKTVEILGDPRKLGKASAFMQEWVNNGKKPLTKRQKASLKSYLKTYTKRSGEPVTDRMIDALIVHAELKAALAAAGPDGVPTAFKTSLALESDGITDGIINALMHMSTSEFTPEFFKLMARGGVFFSKNAEDPISVDDFIAMYGEDENGNSLYLDIYKMVAKHFENAIQKDLDTSTGEERAKKEALYRLVDAFVPGFDSNGGFFNIGRDFVKNPSMVFIYGSSASGIAGKIKGELMDGFHEMLTDLAQGNKSKHKNIDSLFEDIQLVAGFATTDKNGNKTFERKALDNAKNKPSADNATLARKTIQSLKTAIEVTIAEVLTDSVDQITGGLQAEMKFTQRISNLQAELFKISFERSLKVAIDAKEASYENGTLKSDVTGAQHLTENEIQKIFKEAMKVAPIYQGADTDFHISTGERIADSKYSISNSFSKKLPGNWITPSPKDAGVKVSPYMTIGVGDGGMIVEVYADGSVEVKNTLPIYDGVEQGLENVIASSRRINKAAYDGWMNGDIHGPVHQSFAQTLSFFSAADFGKLSSEQQALLKRALGYNQNGKRGPKGAQETWAGYKSILAELVKSETKALESKARKATMKRMGMHSDHMSVAKSPYVTKGEGIESGNARDYDGITNLANSILKEELSKLKGSRDKTRAQPAIQAPTPTMMKLVQALGKPVNEFPNVAIVTGAQLLPRLVSDIGANQDQITMLRDILTKEANKKGVPYADSPLFDTKFYFGSSADLEKIRARDYPLLAKMDKNKPIQAGVTYPQANVVFIANLAPETLLHEMLHKVVDEFLQMAEKFPDKVPAHSLAAYNRLKAMVQHVRRMKTGAMPANQQASMQILLDVLNKHEGNSYAQVSELISWGMANQNIVEQFKNQRVDSPFIKIVNKVLEYVSRMLGIKMHGRDFYANLKFNTEVLIAPETEKQKANKTKAQAKGLSDETSSTTLRVVEETNTTEDDVIDQDDVWETVLSEARLDQVFGEDYSLETVENRFKKKLNSELEKYQNPTSLSDIEIQAQLMESIKKAADAANYFDSQGLDLNAREHLAFRSVHSVMTGVFKMDTGAMSQAYKMYRHFINTVTEDDLHTANGADLANLTAADKKLAKDQYDALTGKDGIRKQAGGKAELLAGFMALAQVHPGMRSIVEDMAPPKDIALENETFDDMVTSAAESAVSLITRYTTSQDKPKGSVAQELAVIAGALTEVNKESATLNLLVKLNPTGRVNNAVSGYIDKASSAASFKLGEMYKDADARGAGRLVKGPLLAATVVTALGSKAASEGMSKMLTSTMNKMKEYETLRSLMTDILGQNDDNKDLYKLLNQAKSVINRIRQSFRVDVPNNLASYFKTTPTKQQWAHFTQAIAKSGIMDLGRSQGLNLLRNMSQLATETRKQEDVVRALAGNLTPKYMDKAKMLARYTMTGIPESGNLLTNTYAITHLLNEGTNISARAKARSSVDLFEAIDKLTSLYAVALISPEAKATMEYMALNEPAGLEKVAGYHENVTKLEKEKLGANNITDPQDVGRLYNGWKGYIPATPGRGASVMIADDLDETVMIRKGYTRGAKYHGDPSEGYVGTRSVYYSSVTESNNFRQGAAQNVHASYMGTDMKTGLSMNGPRNTAILGKTVGAIRRRIQNKYANRSMDNLPAGDHLIPRFDANGVVSAYERTMDPTWVAKMKKDENMGRMLGVWAGRIFEEAHAREFNESLFKGLKANYDKDYASSPDEYTNVADPKNPDPVIRDAWKNLGAEGKLLGKKYFGAKNEVWIKTTKVDDAIGYRQAGVTDPWTGVSRWSPETQESMKRAAIGLIGNKAYTALVTGERGIQDVVSYAKDNFIVRSLIVMYDNFTSNKLQLLTLGVTPLAIARGTRAKALEVIEYNKNIKKINALTLDIDASIDSLSERKIAQMEAEIAALEAANAGMTIAVLIKAGEHNTAAEGLDEDEQDLRENKLFDYLETAVNKLPSAGKTILKNAVISKDTAIYQSLNRMVQYGDFIDKAILYDHLTQNKGMTEEEALDVIRDAFVNYNLAPGRVRDFFERNGVLWFWSYKLRILKTAISTIRNNPVSALLFGGMVAPGLGIDSVGSGTIVAQAASGDLLYSVGPEMALHSFTMNPIEGILTAPF